MRCGLFVIDCGPPAWQGVARRARLDAVLHSAIQLAWVFSVAFSDGLRLVVRFSKLRFSRKFYYTENGRIARKPKF